jgi:hypothetical protein
MVDSQIQLAFPSVAGKDVLARFDGGDLTSDAGVLLVELADRKIGLTQALASSAPDVREQAKVRHTILEMMRERIYAIACGYEDANDLDTLRSDPALKLACERRPQQDAELASQPTLSRLENRLRPRDLLAMGSVIAQRVVAELPEATECVVLDVDATDDPCHGQQQFELFNGFYDTHCYLPLHLYVTGPDGKQRLMASLLRPGNASYRTGLFGLLRRAVGILRARFPQLRIILRADAGFGYYDVLAFCEAHDVRYVLGLRANSRLAVLSTPVQMRAAVRHGKYGFDGWTGDDSRLFDEFRYEAGSWPHARRVIAKLEVTQGKLNPRYVVTDLVGTPEQVYDYYCLRGDCENRIKELKLDLSSGRTSCHKFLANQARLLLHTAAYVLVQAIQSAAAGTEWATAQVGTLRLRLLKVAARVVESCRRIWIHLPTSYPNRGAWQHLHRRLRAEAT